MILLISALNIIIFGIFIISDLDVAPIMGLVGFGLFLLLYLVSKLTPILSASRLKNSNPECIISKDGLILGKQYHDWTSMGYRLESVRLINNEQPLLEIVYSYPVRSSRQYYTLLVPVPSDQFEQAKQIIEILKQ